jgi:hypothetical protein
LTILSPRCDPAWRLPSARAPGGHQGAAGRAGIRFRTAQALRSRGPVGFLTQPPRGRYTSTDDLAADLAALRDRHAEGTASTAGALPSPKTGGGLLRTAAVPGVAALLLLTAVGAWVLRHPQDTGESSPAGATYTRLTDWDGSELDAAISRDGKFVTFLSDRISDETAARRYRVPPG